MSDLMYEDEIEHANDCICGECVPAPPPTPDADLPGGPCSADL